MANISQDFSKGPPQCHYCNAPASLAITGYSNMNGNQGRPYYFCDPCNTFIVFADNEGNDPTNPDCRCGTSSKRGVAGWASSQPGRGFFNCRLGRCSFWQWDEEDVEEPDFNTLMIAA
ncbi:uncharacterized protein F4807DRAFT_443299 [Annulohypoxylon truncatum]|uniref:uncharacterized protein n=1 Tax=Annulohypoxylon truncatum TaxID=327061 RepID=UPI00200738E5|nr:uncharacterized protein F4807DRAFT_443299 [Annulohypoxylon truncatum]KAI1205438.1 hypothetical protein F4807DRAFT_443299 [Annulohypoxylon truncatum]